MLWSPNTRANTLSGQLRSGATLVREAHALAENNVTGSRRSFRAAGSPYRADSNHRALLQLSRDPDGQPRVLTTNFDTLFEHAAVESGVKDVPSHACKSLPKPGGAQDFGILHLHGRIADKALGLSASDLVLTSADFGDAYLREGGRRSTLRADELVVASYLKNGAS